MAKKNNPGCNCCGGKVLIWDMGQPLITSRVGATCEPQSYVTSFLNAQLIKQYLQEYDEDIEVHHALVGEDGIDTLTPSYYGTTPGTAQHHDFNPETSGVDLEYWTGDIKDYKLVYWVNPLDTIDSSATGGVDCFGDHPPDCPSNEYVHGGFPSWWDTIKQVANSDELGDVARQWQGRIVIVTSDNLSCGNTGDWVSNVYIRNAVAPTISRLTIRPSYRTTAGDSLIAQLQAGTYAGAVNSADPLLVDPDNPEATIPLVSHFRSTSLTGGTPLVTNNAGGWTDCCDLFGTPLGSYAVVSHQTIRGIDFVLSGSYVSVAGSTQPPASHQTATKKFVQSLWKTPIDPNT